MRSLKITTKVTLWYSGFLFLIMAAVLGILSYFSESVLTGNKKEELVRHVEDMAEEWKEDQDEFEAFDDGIYFLLYGNDGALEEGSMPDAFDSNTSLKNGMIQTIGDKQDGFYVYDRQITDKRGNTVWVRGVVSAQAVAQLSGILLGISFFILPLLAILSIIAGAGVTKRAFIPVRKMQQTAKEIADSNDLSARIGLPPGKDEITELAQTFDEMLERLEQTFNREKQFTSDASHELRTPISVILNESEYALMHVDTMEEATESFEVIHRQAKKMSSLINQLLMIARADQGNVAIQYDKMNISTLVEELVEDAQILAEEKNITIFCEIEPDVVIIADRMLCARAIHNVLENSVAYGNENGETKVSVRKENEFAVVTIADNGIGIAEEALKKIWDRFYQADPARSAKRLGSMGLGLSMTKWILEKHEGRVQVKSKEGEGSEFSLYFPIKK
ncbi:MAG: HAMP domain-containing protein [Lachnospiraceae bacterium]|nr:HAMP domain-containing protein [Lachnospiraceae bacterium]